MTGGVGRTSGVYVHNVVLDAEDVVGDVSTDLIVVPDARPDHDVRDFADDEDTHVAVLVHLRDDLVGTELDIAKVDVRDRRQRNVVPVVARPLLTVDQANLRGALDIGQGHLLSCPMRWNLQHI
ncbi:hypothetical protein H7Y29_02570 [Microbacteriaceae bacterium]|nr:hypothetical protein [Candidatus Saccharibacteria bacterium]